MNSPRKLIRLLSKINSRRILLSGEPPRMSTKLSGNSKPSLISVRVSITSSFSSKTGRNDFCLRESKWRSCARSHLTSTSDSPLICLREVVARTTSSTALTSLSKSRTFKCILKMWAYLIHRSQMTPLLTCWMRNSSKIQPSFPTCALFSMIRKFCIWLSNSCSQACELQKEPSPKQISER